MSNTPISLRDHVRRPVEDASQIARAFIGLRSSAHKAVEHSARCLWAREPTRDRIWSGS